MMSKIEVTKLLLKGHFDSWCHRTNLICSCKFSCLRHRRKFSKLVLKTSTYYFLFTKEGKVLNKKFT